MDCNKIINEYIIKIKTKIDNNENDKEFFELTKLLVNYLDSNLINKFTTNDIVNNNDYILAQTAIKFYHNKDYNLCNNIITNIYNKYKDSKLIDIKLLHIIGSYITSNTYYNCKIEACDKLIKILENNDLSILSVNFTQYLKNTICHYYLKIGLYDKCYPYINNINSLQYFNCNEMKIFSINDTNKSLLLYDGGGLGDFFMLARLIFPLIELYKNNIIYVLVPPKLKWIYDKVFDNYININIIDKFDKLNYDYHCSLIKLIHYLNINYDNIPFNNYLKNINITKTLTSDNTKMWIKSNINHTYIINWKGNNNNLNGTDRNIPLNKLEIIFNTKFNFIVLTKELTNSEKNILKKYNNVIICSDNIDKDNAFSDTIKIMKMVTGIITTDTSLVHIAGILNVHTILCLDYGYHWIWGNGIKSNWYPDIKIIKQDSPLNWNNVIKNVIEYINKYKIEII